MENRITSAAEGRFDELFNETKKQYTKAVDRMYGEKELDMQEVERLFGQMEFPAKMDGRDWLRDFLRLGELKWMDYKEKRKRIESCSYY